VAAPIEASPWRSPTNPDRRNDLSTAFSVPLDPAPEVTVEGDGLAIPDNDTTPRSADGTDFGVVVQGGAAIRRTFYIWNDGDATLTLRGLSVPSGFTVTNGLVNRLAPGTSDAFTVELDTSTAGTKTGQIRFATNDSDENPFNFSITGTVTVPAAPEVRVTFICQSIADGDTTPSALDGTDFGSVPQGTPAYTRTYAVRNDGTATLTLSNLSVPPGFTATDGLVSSLPPGGVDALTVRLDTATVGTKRGQISFATNDADENPYNFSITGTVTSNVVSGTPQSVPYLQGFNAGKPDAAAGWDYYSSDSGGRIEVVNGRVRIDRSPSGAYTLNEAVLHLDLSGRSGLELTLDHTSLADERHTMPASFVSHANGDGIAFSADGVTWHKLTDLVDNFTGQTFDLDAAVSAAGIGYTSDFRIKFQQYDNYSASTDGREFDNIRIDVVEPTAPEVTVTFSGRSIADGDTTPSAADGTDFGSVAQGTPAYTRTYAVRNDGTAPLTLSGLTVPPGFTATDGLVGSLPPGGVDALTVRLDTATAGTKSGQISFATNDSDENPFNFSITGTVTGAATLDQSQTRANYGFWFEQSVPRWQEFTPSLSQLRQVSLFIYRTGNPGDLWVAVERVSDGQRVWSTQVSESQVSTGTAWLDVQVSPAIALTPGTKYRLVVWGDRPSPNPSNRYFWRGQTGDNAYAAGDSCVERSWPGYDFAFRTYGA